MKRHKSFSIPVVQCRLYVFVVCCLVLSFLMSFERVLAQNSKNALRYELFEHKLFVSHTSTSLTDSLHYRLLFPKNYDASKKYPLVVFLHGAGERGDSSLTVKHIGAWALQEKNRAEYPCFVLVPQCEKKHRWVEVDWGADAHTQPDSMSRYMSLTVQVLHQIEQELPIDTTRIYLTGLSMGGYGVWDLASRFPKKFAAIVPICGGADEKTASLLSAMPIWVFHGALDKVVKPQRSRNMVKALQRAGNITVRYTEYPDVQHGSWKSAYQTDALWKWLFEQHR